jgi:hypothetical protein
VVSHAVITPEAIYILRLFSAILRSTSAPEPFPQRKSIYISRLFFTIPRKTNVSSNL